MTFNHVDLNLEPLERETIDGVRYYSFPDVDELVKLVLLLLLPVILIRIL